VVTHVTNDVVFELADGFVDRTSHDLDLPLGGGDALGAIVARSPMAATTPLEVAVREHVLMAAKRLVGYRLLEQTPSELGGRPAMIVAARWSYRGASLYTREVHAVRGAELFTLAMTAPLDRRELCDEHFAHVTGSFRFA
jgi:hypothetical protein